MHAAPAVSFPVGRSRLQAGLTVLVAVAGAAGLAGWMLQADAVDELHVSVVLLWLVVTCFAVWQWIRTPTAALAWDGQNWTLATPQASMVVLPQVVLDLQSDMLLCLHVADNGRRCWVWPQRSRRAEHWLPLRHALFGQSPVDPGLAAVGDAPVTSALPPP